MRKCKLNSDELKDCSCLKKIKGILVCDVYGEPIKGLKKCPVEEKE